MTDSSIKKLFRFAVTSFLFLSFASPCWAAPLSSLAYQEPQAVAPPSMGELLVRLIVSLVVVLGLAFLAIKFLQKRTMITQTGRWIRIIDQVCIGSSKALLLAEIAGRIYVLGVTDHNISKLLEIEETSQIAAILEESLDADVSPWKNGILPKLWSKPFHYWLDSKGFDSVETKEGE